MDWGKRGIGVGDGLRMQRVGKRDGFGMKMGW